jgi:uncharacterized surface protein with fasciclin (FAS1) repeats
MQLRHLKRNLQVNRIQEGTIMTVLKRYAALAFTAIAISFTGLAQAAHHEGGHGHKANIVEVAAGNDDFSTLVAAVKAAGLVEVLAGDGPYTVFAPTNAAFAKLPEGTVENLLKPENREQLVAILKYHVVPGKVMAADVVGLDSATTAQGSDISIAASDAGVTVDNANVIMTDVEASNGVIHVIDTVILPSA